MYVDSQGFVWVVDREGHQVVKLTPDGEAVMKLGEYGVFGADEGHFNGPTGVAFLSDGRVVVSDGYWNSRLVERHAIIFGHGLEFPTCNR